MQSDDGRRSIYREAADQFMNQVMVKVPADAVCFAVTMGILGIYSGNSSG